MRKIAGKIVSLFKHCNGLKSEIDPNGKLIKLRGERFALVQMPAPVLGERWFDCGHQ